MKRIIKQYAYTARNDAVSLNTVLIDLINSMSAGANERAEKDLELAVAHTDNLYAIVQKMAAENKGDDDESSTDESGN